eukprot:1159502-Pelagomonas_calceolata.AAC.14
MQAVLHMPSAGASHPPADCLVVFVARQRGNLDKSSSAERWEAAPSFLSLWLGECCTHAKCCDRKSWSCWEDGCELAWGMRCLLLPNEFSLSA